MVLPSEKLFETFHSFFDVGNEANDELASDHVFGNKEIGFGEITLGLIGKLSGEPVVLNFGGFGVLFEGPEFYFWIVGYFPGGDLDVVEHADSTFDGVSKNGEETFRRD